MFLPETAGRISHLNDEEPECLENCFEATEVCEWSVDECERHDAEHCQVCADVLRECAKTCRNVASAS